MFGRSEMRALGSDDAWLFIAVGGAVGATGFVVGFLLGLLF